MLNLMRADFYRLRHSRSLLIWEVFILGFTIFTTVNWGREKHLTGWLAVQLVNNSGGLFLWLLPLIMMTVGHDFSQKLLKDTLTMGISRRRYFLSKMATTVIVLILQLFALQLIAFLGGIMYGGLGPVQWGDWLAQLLVYVFLTTTEVTLITMVLYWSNSTTAAISVGFLAILAVAILHFQFANLEILNYTDWIISISQLKTVHLNSLGTIAKPVIGAAVLIIGGGIINDWRFERMSL
ncbi:MAG: ABC transporter permease [Schleiferilactobacillus perolens]|jgi:ABC-type transport system involved in multi-copper enzyme maturation permease subunit|uniref:ABC transporter permease n=1 Tax=Schleiferilactobacillus perolens TaxID=100468 RepID=UPI0039EBC04B|nr:ABC transporter permease [Schleiferilactobacillus harbinensis]MCI1913423.1 ABC transporter permease [Schleiferilactobacillus harbinensis]